MAKTLYNYWFVQFDFPNEEGKPYKSSGGKMSYNSELKREIPKRWEVKALDGIATVNNDSVNPQLFSDIDFRHYSIPTYDATGTYGIEKGKEINSNKFTVLSNDILVSKLNPWFSRVIYGEDKPNIICSTEFVVWRSRDINLKNYLFMIAHDKSFITYCTQNATGTSNSHKRVNPTVMMNYTIAYDEKVAEKYEKIIDSVLKLILKNKKQNQELIKVRDFLLPLLMNGQVKVK
jgi:type I restriction enzyme, S subunit